MTLSEIIVGYREEHGYSQRQMAKISGISNGYISMLEAGMNPKTGAKIIPTLPMLKKLCTTLGMSIEELMSKADDLEVDLSSSEEILSEFIPTHKEIALKWIREEASKDEKVELLKELADLL